MIQALLNLFWEKPDGDSSTLGQIVPQSQKTIKDQPKAFDWRTCGLSQFEEYKIYKQHLLTNNN